MSDRELSLVSLVVVIRTSDRAAETLFQTKDMKVALHAIGVMQLFAPDATMGLYLWDYSRPGVPGGRVLLVQDGHWHLRAPRELVEAAALDRALAPEAVA